MTYPRLRFANFLILISLLACSNGNPGNAKDQIPLPLPGIIHREVICTGNPGRSYAIYIPAGKPATGAGSRPVIIAFDPHGDGTLPLTIYKSLADKFGFVLIGSNDSKNGLPAEALQSIIAAMDHEVRALSGIDTNRIYLLGFSGGARVASMAAMYQVQVKGIIACGAGLGNTENPVKYQFDYFGIAGTADFNMNEVLQLDEPLSRAGIRHFIKTFPGIHAWPPAAVMEDAFVWITLNAMKDKSLAMDTTFISAVSHNYMIRVQGSETDGNFIKAASDCREAISCLDGLSSTDKFSTELRQIKSMEGYMTQVAHNEKVREKEEAEKQELMEALQTKDLVWWNERIKKYRKISGDDTLKNRRLLSFLSLFCYMNANAVITQHNETAGIRIVAIYEMADPSNPEPNYMRAIIYAGRNDAPGAMEQLKLATSKGFDDTARLNAQSEFVAMHAFTGWSDLLKNMKK